VAGKTGTTQGNGDAWFVGYTPGMSVAVWMGYPEGQARQMRGVHGVNVTGGTLPADIFRRYMEVAADREEYRGEFVAPPRDRGERLGDGRRADDPEPTTTTAPPDTTTTTTSEAPTTTTTVAPSTTSSTSPPATGSTTSTTARPAAGGGTATTSTTAAATGAAGGPSPPGGSPEEPEPAGERVG
jgi:membrane peptidoglycan carboxypeptidase